MRSFFKLAVLAALGAVGAGTTSAQAASSIWDHNGSKMTLEENGEKRKLIYTEPREGLDKAGIRQGTVLFNGERKANGRLAGFAKIFKGTCNPVDYFVEGTQNEAKGEIVLQGQAPVYAAGTSCEVTGYSDSSAASTLRFARIGDAPAGDVVAGRAPDQQFEQGDRGPADEYLPPAQRGRSANVDEDERDERYYADPRYREALPPRDRLGRYGDSYDDRRYSRRPDPYDERPYRRRPGIWDPQEEVNPDEDGEYDDYDRPPPPSPLWGRRWQ